MKAKDLLSTPQTCRFIGITRQTLYTWIKERKIRPWGRMGGGAAWLFLKSEVLRVSRQASKGGANGR